jgi:hypothetical protein
MNRKRTRWNVYIRSSYVSLLDKTEKNVYSISIISSRRMTKTIMEESNSTKIEDPLYPYDTNRANGAFFSVVFSLDKEETP